MSAKTGSDPPARTADGGPGGFDPAAIAQAEAAVAALAADYRNWVRADLAQLQEAWEKASAGTEGRRTHLDAMFTTAHNIKGQAGTFGYPLVGRIAGSLCAYLRRAESAADLNILAAHVEALRAILANGVSGDGGPLGREIAEGLEKAARRAPG